MTPREPFKRSGHLHSPSTARNPHAPPDSALTAPLIGLRTKVHHCSLQSDRRVPFEEVCPIATWAICAVPEAVQRSGQLPPF